MSSVCQPNLLIISHIVFFREILLKKAKMKAKKKPRRRSDSSGGYTLSDIIQSPPAAGMWLSASL